MFDFESNIVTLCIWYQLTKLSPGSAKYTMGLAAAKAAKSISEPVPDWATDACRMNREIIEIEREVFSSTWNPMCAIRAYVESRLAGDPLPEWVIKYFDRAVDTFWNSFVGFARETPK